MNQCFTYSISSSFSFYGNATEASHVDINYPHGVKQPKKKLPAGGGL